MASALHELKTLMRSFHPLIVVETVEEDRLVGLVERVASEIGLAVFEWSAAGGLEKRGREGSVVPTAKNIRQMIQHCAGLTVHSAFIFKDFAAMLEDPTLIRTFREWLMKLRDTRSVVIMVGPSVELPAELEHKCARYEMTLPNADELRRTIRSVLDSFRGRQNVPVTMSPEGAGRMVEALRGLTQNQARQAIAQAILDDGALTDADIPRVLDRKAEVVKQNGLLEYLPFSDNEFELGGLGGLKRWLDRAKVGFSAEAKAYNLSPPKGVLLTGIQGCGKSLAAKAIARTWQLPLLKLDAGRLYDKYIGETERNFRRATQMAETLSPCVLWLDEMEKAFAQGGDSSNDGGVSKRVFGSFLVWLQEKEESVFVVGTTNDVFSLPPELLRKGRFDEIFFVDLPDASERETIFGIHLRLRNQSVRPFDIAALIEASDGFSGAEIEQAIVASLYQSLYERNALDTAMILQELGQTVPLSRSRREDIERLRAVAHERFVPARG